MANLISEITYLVFALAVLKAIYVVDGVKRPITVALIAYVVSRKGS